MSSDRAALDEAPRELRARPQAELAIGAGESRLDGLRRHVETRGDLGVPQSLGRQLGDAGLGGGERARAALAAKTPLLGFGTCLPEGAADRRKERSRLGEGRTGIAAAAEAPQDAASDEQRAAALERPVESLVLDEGKVSQLECRVVCSASGCDQGT